MPLHMSHAIASNMRSFKIFRLILRRYRRKTFMALIAMCCLIFAVTTIILPFNNDHNTKVFMSIYLRPRNAIATNTNSSVEAPGDELHDVDDAQGQLENETTVDEVTGRLNLHVWRICGFDVNSLRQSPLFPHFPDRKAFVTNFTSAVRESHIGQRVFGFVYPHATGEHQFAITSDDTSELWLSTNEDPRKVRLIAKVHKDNKYAWTAPGDYKKYPAQISGEIFLNSGQKYFVESLHKNGKGIGHVSVYWKPPGEGEFSIITEDFVSPFCAEDNEKRSSCTDYGLEAPLRIPSHFKEVPRQPVSEETIHYYHNTSVFNRRHLEDVLPVLTYEPSYVVRDGKVGKYRGIRLVLAHHISVYPEDVVQIKRGSHITKSVRVFRPNEVLPMVDAELVVSQFISGLESQHGRRFSLEKVIGVEGKVDKPKGSRYFLELQLHDSQERKSLLLAEYVFRDYGGNLWFPEGIAWKRNAAIHFIVPVKNQFKWVVFFVKEVSKLYLRTRDDNFHLVIVDFESTDGDIDKLLRNSPLARRFTLLKKTGAFHKTLAIQDAVKSVRDPDSIVFLFDLHITVPITLLDSIRKHTIQNKTVFLPIVARLDCGFSPANPKGRWEEMGSGLVAVYKSDWLRFHGMNVEEYKTKWGGEDWDLLDRMLRVGLEAERFKFPGFYHFYHSKSGMWNK